MSDTPARETQEDQAPAAHRADVEAAPFQSQRALLLRDARRVWMSAPAKRAPHTIALLSLRLPQDAARSPAATTMLHRAYQTLREALEDLGTVYIVAPHAIAVILPDRAVHHATHIGEALKSAVDQQNTKSPETPLVLTCGISALHRDGDPTAAVCTAEHCFALAEQSGVSKVLSEMSPEARVRSRPSH